MASTTARHGSTLAKTTIDSFGHVGAEIYPSVVIPAWILKPRIPYKIFDPIIIIDCMHALRVDLHWGGECLGC